MRGDMFIINPPGFGVSCSFDSPLESGLELVRGKTWYPGEESVYVDRGFERVAFLLTT